MKPETLEKVREAFEKGGTTFMGDPLKFYWNGSGYTEPELQKAFSNFTSGYQAAERVEESADVRQVPVAWVCPGDDNERDGGWIDARISCEGEFTKPLYAAPTAPGVAGQAPGCGCGATCKDDIGCRYAAAPKPAVNELISVTTVACNPDDGCPRVAPDKRCDGCPAHKPESVSDNATDSKASELLRAAVNETKLCSDCIAGETCCRPALRDAVEFLAHGTGDNVKRIGSWQEQLADALDCFWNPAVGGARGGMDPASSVAEGISAVAQRLREHAAPKPVAAETTADQEYEALRLRFPGWMPPAEPANKTPDSYTGQEGRVQVTNAMLDRLIRHLEAGGWRNDMPVKSVLSAQTALEAALSEQKS